MYDTCDESKGCISQSGGYKQARPGYALMLKPCSEKRVPPAKKHVPSTNTTSSRVSQIGGDRCSSRRSRKLFKIKPTTMKMERSEWYERDHAKERKHSVRPKHSLTRNLSWVGKLGCQPIRYGEDSIGTTCDNRCRKALMSSITDNCSIGAATVL